MKRETHEEKVIHVEDGKQRDSQGQRGGGRKQRTEGRRMSEDLCRACSVAEGANKPVKCVSALSKESTFTKAQAAGQFLTYQAVTEETLFI